VPTPTFHNLPEQKRQKIADLAVAEFASRPYREASLNRIVARAGIAKGSIYQYFSGKLDLYRWVVTEELTRRKREAAVAAVAGPPPVDLFEALERQCAVGLELFLAHPRLARLGMRLLEPAPDPALRRLHDEARRAGIAWMREELGRAQAKGQVRADIDLDVAAHVVAQALGLGLPQALMDRLGTDLERFMARPIPLEKIPKGEVGRLARAAVDLLRRGLCSMDKETRQ
jgi:TetR/AcrR family transcriptional regulator